MLITIIAGARPNFMKIAPIIHAIIKEQDKGTKVTYRLVHTGQHYDQQMSDTFFKDLDIPEPNTNLGCGGGSQAEQTAAIMIAFEKELLMHPSDLVLVVGDVTSTMACSIVAKKLNTKVAHVEAGIRSFDLSMPEEINRMVTDSLTDYFFTTTITADDNLRRIGVSSDYIYRVGNTMIDTLIKQRPRFLKPVIWDKIGLIRKEYIVMTLHRPSNVDEEKKFNDLLITILKASQGLPIIFPIHPRTAKKVMSILSGSGEESSYYDNLHIIEPLGYLEFNYLVERSLAVITDSGGITEETTVMGVPCMTLRDNTERPETITLGTNELLGTNPVAIKTAFEKLLSGDWKKGGIPDLWDGFTAERIVKVIVNLDI